MPNPAALRAKVNTVLRKVTPLESTVCKRFVTQTGDKLLGRTSAPVYQDTELNPQPVYSALTNGQAMLGGRAGSALVLANGKQVTAGDMVFTLSADALTVDEVQNPGLILVCKNSGGEESFFVVGYSISAMGGVTIAYTVYGRSAKR